MVLSAGLCYFVYFFVVVFGVILLFTYFFLGGGGFRMVNGNNTFLLLGQIYIILIRFCNHHQTFIYIDKHVYLNNCKLNPSLQYFSILTANIMLLTILLHDLYLPD